MNADKLADALREIRTRMEYQQLTPLVAAIIAICCSALAEHDAQAAQAAQPKRPRYTSDELDAIASRLDPSGATHDLVGVAQARQGRTGARSASAGMTS